MAGRKRLHVTQAKRQAAYRERQNALRSALINLHEGIKCAARRGDSLLLNPHDVLGNNPEETLIKLNFELRFDDPFSEGVG